MIAVSGSNTEDSFPLRQGAISTRWQHWSRMIRQFALVLCKNNFGQSKSSSLFYLRPADGSQFQRERKHSDAWAPFFQKHFPINSNFISSQIFFILSTKVSKHERTEFKFQLFQFWSDLFQSSNFQAKILSELLLEIPFAFCFSVFFKLIRLATSSSAEHFLYVEKSVMLYLFEGPV